MAHVDGDSQAARIFLAAPLSAAQLESLTAKQREVRQEVSFNAHTALVQAWQVTRYGALLLKQERILAPDPTILARALLDGVRTQGLSQLPWNPALLQWWDRVNVLARLEPEHWPSLEDNSLEQTLETWLLPFLNGLQRLDSITPELLQQALE